MHVPFLSILIGLVGRVFANGPGDRGSIPGRVIPKTGGGEKKKEKRVLDTSLLNIQHYKVRIKGKVEQSRERSIEKGIFRSPSTTVANMGVFVFRQNIYMFT